MTFDPDSFMSQKIDQALSDKFEQVPEGDYKFMVDDFDSSIFRTNDRKDNSGTFTTFEIPLVLQDEAVKAKLGRDKVTVRYKGFLDFDDKGQLDFRQGKNVKLGMLRSALGQNVPGQPWSFEMLKGAGPVMGRVIHTKNDKDKDNPFTEVSRVAKIS